MDARARRLRQVGWTTLALAVSALAFAACDESREPSPSVDETVNPIAPDVALELLECKPRDSILEGRVRVTNRSDHIAWFRGYGADAPLYALEQLIDGEWRSQQALFCGTGLDARPLAAGASVVWKWHGWVDELAPTRVGVGFSSMRAANDNRGAVMIAWSESFQPPTRTVDAR
jgi:hypothetical protein